MVRRRAGWGTTEAAAGRAGVRAAVRSAVGSAAGRAPAPAPAARTGPAEVVLVHGLGCSHRYFRRLAEEFARRGTSVAAPDLPGFGLTPPPPGGRHDVEELAADLDSWLSATGRSGLPIVANSFGAQVAVELAVAYPDAVGPLVLVGPAPDPRAATLLAQAVRLARNTAHESPRVAVLLGRDYLTCGPRGYLATARAGLRHPTHQRIRHVEVPVTVVRGARDRLCSPEWATELAEAAGGRYVEVPGAAHLAHWSHPEAVAGALDALGARA